MQACLENNVPNFKVSESPDLNSLDYKTFWKKYKQPLSNLESLKRSILSTAEKISLEIVYNWSMSRPNLCYYVCKYIWNKSGHFEYKIDGFIAFFLYFQNICIICILQNICIWVYLLLFFLLYLFKLLTEFMARLDIYIYNSIYICIYFYNYYIKFYSH